MSWKDFCAVIKGTDGDPAGLKRFAEDNFNKFGVYPESIHFKEGSCFFIAEDNSGKIFVIYGESPYYSKFDGDEALIGNHRTKVCGLSNSNCDELRKIFPFTNPVSHKGIDISVGLGDRLGFAPTGLIRLIKKTQAFPILAQQAHRELDQTGHTFHDIVSSASWSVFQEGYTRGFGADGDHLKTVEEIDEVLGHGFSRVTIDSSGYINNITAYTQDEVEKKYLELPQTERQHYESEYLDREFTLKCGLTLKFSLTEFKKAVLMFSGPIKFIIGAYDKTIKNCGRSIDFEVTIDEAPLPTTPETHFIIASELVSAGVDLASIAPKFTGRFEKGMDYKGDLAILSKEVEMHSRIAEHFGYKISVHSSSYKYSIFPIIAEKTGGRYHVKINGANWIAAVKTIAEVNPALFRSMYKFMVDNQSAARKYYKISANVANVPDIESIEDNKLGGIFEQDDARQLLNVAYGVFLESKNPDGSSMFKDSIYSTLTKYEEAYYTELNNIIGKHLEKLQLLPRE